MSIFWAQYKKRRKFIHTRIWMNAIFLTDKCHRNGEKKRYNGGKKTVLWCVLSKRAGLKAVVGF